MMNIVVDKNNPYVVPAFQRLGHVEALGTKDITKERLRTVDVLVVRSETKVNRTLLEGSAVRFVGTATIGVDHIDLDYLAANNIGFASAPGSNANSVAEYIVAALLTIAERKSDVLQGKTLAVVGVGNVGKKVVRYAETLGMKVLQNDPPLARVTNDQKYVSLDRCLDADYVTLHVPLTKTGDDATYHLFDARRIARMKPGSVLINTARGGVVDTPALSRALTMGHLSAAVLDVWENEPAIDTGLLRQAAIATPHIAGYSLDGKLNAVEIISHAVSEYFSMPFRWEKSEVLSSLPRRRISLSDSVATEIHLLRNVIQQCYDIERDDTNLRALSAQPQDERKTFFSRLRAEYPVRREFSNATIYLPPAVKHQAGMLGVLGFTVE